MPHCAGGPLLAWQTAPETLQVARVGAGGLTPPRAYPVGSPPLRLAANGQALRAVWADAEGVAGLELNGARALPLRVPMTFPTGWPWRRPRTAGSWPGSRRQETLLAAWPADAQPGAPQAVDLGAAAGGTLTVVAGHRPVVWARRAVYGAGETVSWLSALALPGRAPLLLDGHHHAAGWWGERLAVVGRQQVHFFRVLM